MYVQYMCLYVSACGREKELEGNWSHSKNVPMKVKTKPMPLTASDHLWGYILYSTFTVKAINSITPVFSFFFFFLPQ